MTNGSTVMGDEQKLQHYRSAFLRLLALPYQCYATTLHALLRASVETLSIARASVWTFEPGMHAIRLAHYEDLDTSSALPEPPHLLQESEFPEYFAAVRESFVVAAEDASSDPRTACLHDQYCGPMGIASLLDTPIRTFGQHVGVLCLEHVGTPRRWDLMDQNFAAAIATQISLAMEREELKRTEAQLARRTLYDPLTQLGNLTLLGDCIDEAMARVTPEQTVVLYWLDVEQFRSLGYSVGLPMADALVRAIADRLQQSCPPNARLFRAGVDEFAVLCELGDDASIHDLGNGLLHSVDVPIPIGSRTLRVSLAVGVCLYRSMDGHNDKDLLLRQAKSASAAAKRTGRVHAFVMPDLACLQRAGELEQELRAAIDDGALEPYFQPLVDFNRRRVIGFESLIRWQRGDRVALPGEFLQLALERGLMTGMGRQVMARAFQCFAEHLLPLQDDLHLHINLAGSELLQDDLRSFLVRQMARVGMETRHLVIEVTETVLIEDLLRAAQVIRELQAAGISVYLDDFGTGYASLAYLRDLNFDGIKIDRSFVVDIGSNRTSQAMLDAVTTMAQRLGCDVIAEGIETEAHLLHLSDFPISVGQGYFFAEPQSVAYWTRAHIQHAGNGFGPSLREHDLDARIE